MSALTAPDVFGVGILAVIVFAWCAVYPAHFKYVFVAASLVAIAHWAAEVSA